MESTTSQGARQEDEHAYRKFVVLREETSDEQWRFLAAIAAETTLGVSVLEALGCPSSFLQNWVSAGVVSQAKMVRPLSLRQGASEPGYTVARDIRQHILRHTQETGALGPTTLVTEELLGARSRGALTRMLASGSLVLRPGAVIEPPIADELCASILEPFDSAWFERTWKARAPRVASVVLSLCFQRWRGCEPLYRWACENEAARNDAKLRAEVACHALSRFDDPKALLFDLPEPTKTSLLAIESFLSGHLSPTRQLLLRMLIEGAAQTPPNHPFSPLLALLFLLWEDELKGAPAPQSWLRSQPFNKGALRALSTFKRHREQPEEKLRRLDVHQLSPDATAWELLIHGLTAHRFVENPTSRSSWSERLTHAGSAALDAGFLWQGRQALVLAASLDRVRLEKLLAQHRAQNPLPISATGLVAQPGDLAELVQRRMSWEVGLSALKRLTLQTQTPPTKHRLSWFVDPQAGNVHRPGLMVFESGRGWFLERRVSWQEALELFDELGEEDRTVLGVTALSLDEAGFPHLEVFAALVDHPRVLDGSRAGRTLAIRREACRIETFDETAHLRIGVRPLGVAPGLNLLYDGDRGLAVVCVQGAMEQALEAVPQDLLVPHADAAQALRVLSELGEGISIRSNHLDGDAESVSDDTPSLRITPVAGAFLVELGVQPFGPEGRFFHAATGPALLTGSRGSRRFRTVRDFDKESNRCENLLGACDTLLRTAAREDQPGSWMLGQEQLLDLLGELKQAEQNSGLRHHLSWAEKSPLRLLGQASIGALRGALRANKGWYLLSGSVAIDEVTSISLAQLSRMPFVHGGRYVRLPDGAYVALHDRIRRLAAALACASIDRSGNARLSDAQLLGVRRALEGGHLDIAEDVQARWASLTRDHEGPPHLPSSLNARLRPYQEAGFAWLCSLAKWGLGACLADDMGLGKTLQIIAFLLTRPRTSRHLVVAPLSVCTNWAREIARFAPSLKVQQCLDVVAAIPSPSPDQAEVWIVSYQRLASSVDVLQDIDWDTVVADEAQYVKNPKTQRARALLSLSAKQRIAATGTPVENHLGDVWGIFRFLQPDLLGGWSAFSTHFVKPIEREGDTDRQALLLQILRPFILRRTKGAVLQDLPPRTTVRREVQLNDDEAMRYALLRRQIHERLRTSFGRAQYKLEILAEITRLRRFCCHPRLVFPDAPSDSPKLRELIPLLEELAENGHRVLVFSQYVDFLTLVRERLNEHGIQYEYLDGSCSQSERQRSIDNFSNHGAPVFLLSLKAGGLGLNLTAADYVIHLDPWWNPAVAAQATDRAHRIGQSRSVTVYEFVTAHTIEEDILRLHESKSDLSRRLLEKADLVGELSVDTLADWLGQALSERGSSGLLPTQSSLRSENSIP